MVVIVAICDIKILFIEITKYFSKQKQDYWAQLEEINTLANMAELCVTLLTLVNEVTLTSNLIPSKRQG